MATDLTEHFVARESEFSGSFITLKRDRVRLPDGSIGQREYFNHPGAVVIAALLPNQELVLERQFRYPVNKVCIELPAGKLDHNEALLTCAQRELREETGYTAKNWQQLTAFHNAIGYSDELLTLFLAEDLTLGPRQLDRGEFLDAFTLPLDTCVKMVMRGEIDDVKTMLGIMWLDKIKSP